MKTSHFLMCLSVFTIILACDSNTDIRLAQTFTFAVNMQGSDQRPDSDFETLVTTQVKTELRELPDVQVVPKGKNAVWRLNLIGWEGANVDDRGTGNIVLSAVIISGGPEWRYEYHLLQTGPKECLEEYCIIIVSYIDKLLDKHRKLIKK